MATIVTPFRISRAASRSSFRRQVFRRSTSFSRSRKTTQLTAAMYVDREELDCPPQGQVDRPAAVVAQRHACHAQGAGRRRLVITSTDLDNVISTKEVPDFKLFDDRETTYEFQVPQRWPPSASSSKPRSRTRAATRRSIWSARAELSAQRDRQDRQDRGFAFCPGRRGLCDRYAGQDGRSRRPIGR